MRRPFAVVTVLACAIGCASSVRDADSGDAGDTAVGADSGDDVGCGPTPELAYVVSYAAPGPACVPLLGLMGLSIIYSNSCRPISQQYEAEFNAGSRISASSVSAFVAAGRRTAGIVLDVGGPLGPTAPGLRPDDCRVPGQSCRFISRSCVFQVVRGAVAQGDIGEAYLAEPCVLVAEPPYSTTTITVTRFHFRSPLSVDIQNPISTTQRCPP